MGKCVPLEDFFFQILCSSSLWRVYLKIKPRCLSTFKTYPWTAQVKCWFWALCGGHPEINSVDLMLCSGILNISFKSVFQWLCQKRPRRIQWCGFFPSSNILTGFQPTSLCEWLIWGHFVPWMEIRMAITVLDKPKWPLPSIPQALSWRLWRHFKALWLTIICDSSFSSAY